MRRSLYAASLAGLLSGPSYALDLNAVKVPEKLQITIMWPGDVKADVDMKIMAPDEPDVVAYQHKRGVHMAITRDELVDPFTAVPPPPVYFETALSDSVRPGFYIINVHGFRGEFPVNVTLVVERISDMGSVHRILLAKAKLVGPRDEKTIASFVINNDGKIDSGSLSQTYRQIGAQFPSPRSGGGIWASGK